MASFIYTGDHKDMEAFGFQFRSGQATEVTGDHAIRKLRGNSHFVEVFDGVEVLDPAPSATEVQAADVVEPGEQAEAKRRGRPPKAK
jgi:hypothetical protein